MKEIMERFAKYMQIKGLNDNQVTVECGLGQGLLGNARKGKSDLGKKSVSSILNKYQDLSRVWLLTGEGEMLNVSEFESEDNSKRGFMEVPLLNLDARGGFSPNSEAGEGYVQKLIPWGGARSGDFAVEVSGVSMMPQIPPGSRVLLRQVEDWREYLEKGLPYVIELRDDRRLLKVIQKSDKGEGFFLLVSYNPEVEPEPLPVNLVRRVYKVVGTMVNFGF